MSVTASPVERDVVWVGTSRAKCGAQGTLGRPGSRPADWRHSSRRRNGPFRRDRILITCAGSRATRSSRNDSGSRSRPARSCPRVMAAAPGATAFRAGRGIRTSSPFTTRLPIRSVSPPATDISKVTTRGITWCSPSAGLEVGYLRSVAIDPEQPEVVVVSASSGPHSAYVAGRSDGRLYRRIPPGGWERVHDGWPEPASTVAPLLCAGAKARDLWAADERGVHRSDDGGKSWRRVVGYATSPQHLRGLALVR